MLRVVSIPTGALGFDTIARPSRLQYQALRALGFRFAVRYLGDLTDVEISDATAEGVGVIPIQHARAVNWIVDPQKGAEDGLRAARDASAVNIPVDQTLWCDLEGCHPSTTPSAVQLYSESWCGAARAAGYLDQGVYHGAGVPSSGAELFRLAFTGYFRSQSDVPCPMPRGWRLIQLFDFPKGQCTVADVFPDAPAIVAGLQIDVDIAQADYRGVRAKMLVAG